MSNTTKFRHLISKVIINKDSKASVVQDILCWLKESINNVEVVYKKEKK